MDEAEIDRPGRRRRLRGWRIPVAVLLALLIGTLVIVWLMRVDLATGYIDRELARRGVQATYEVRRIGLRNQVFEHLVIGDPRRPDATARHVEVQILLGLTGPRVGLITARGVRMFGTLRDGQLSLGQIDKLLPPPSGLPFRLPDQRIDIADSAIVLDTPAGLVSLALEGRGNLSDGFRGELAGISRELVIGECEIDLATASFDVSVDDLSPTFDGPMGFQSLRCGDDLSIRRPLVEVETVLAPAFDSWRGGARVHVERFLAGPQYLEGVEGRLTFAGNADRTRGGLSIGAAGASVDAFRANALGLSGRYAISPREGDIALNGDVAVRGLQVRESDLAGITGLFSAAQGTPAEPIGKALAAAVLRAGRSGADATADFQLVNETGVGAIRLDRLRFDARSGARLSGERITYHWPSGMIQVDGAFALTGGGFPDARFELRQARAGAPIEGVGRIEAMQIGDSRLALGGIRFAAAPGGQTRFRTVARLDGPFDGGRVTGLVVPLSGRFGTGGLAIGEGCVTVTFRALVIEGLRLDSTRLPLCPGGPALVWQRPGGAVQVGAEIRSPRLAGQLGASPFALAAGRIRVNTEGLSAAGLDVRLGPAGSTSRLSVASLEGRFVERGVTGRFSGLEGEIANVPLLIEESSGRWQVVRGDVLVEGRIRVSDARDPPRFYPLVSDDFRMTVVDGRIHATGWLENPGTGIRITHATVEHDIDRGVGEALLDVPGIAFGESFQPERLTPLTLGVVALVEGTLTGEGRIAWDGNGTRSSGTFSTADMDLAAPFGPVEGLATTIEFTDLLGLTSAPRQVARIDLVRPGIDVYDGVVVYQLLPNYHVAIESGRWPFSGGELILQPTVLDFSQPSTKYLTFRVIGLDAARFVQQMEFGNISATGTFDGIIPMQFGQSGGRIVGGRLGARPPGGTLSYVGELTDRDLGIYGKMAFDALKELRYERFDLTLDGALDGEFFTDIQLDGVARNPTSTTLTGPTGGLIERFAARAIGQIAALPFEFNIRIQGPFRALIATARSFKDPSLLIQPVLPAVLRDLPTRVVVESEEEERSEESQDVQQEESENRR